MKRVIIALKQNGEIKIPKFTECVLDYFSKNSNHFNVSLSMEGNLLVLRPDSNGHKLLHSPECPIKLHSQSDIKNQSDDIKPEKKNLNIFVAVSVIIESSDQYVLLTKRPTHMRTSPRVWVAPGGHLEYGESLYEGGIREVKEETGLNIQNVRHKILCLWENVYPLIFGLGPPSSHVLVVYFYVKMNETHEELQKKIKLDPVEVESNCWLSIDTVKELFNQKPTKIQKQYIIENGVIVERDLDPNTMFNKLLWQKGQTYSGTQTALKNWIEISGLGDVRFSKF